MYVREDWKLFRNIETLPQKAGVSSQVKPATFRHKPYNILVLSNSLSMLKSVAVTCHVYNFAVMNKSI